MVKNCSETKNISLILFFPASAADQAVDGFPVRDQDGLVLIGLAVCWGSRDAYYISLQQEQSAGKDADARARG